jgi:hypothetical protein
MNEYSLSDVAAVTGNRNNDGMFGNDWAWIIILLLFGYGGRGFGNFGGGMPYGTPATQADLSAGFASNATLNGLNDIKLGQAGIQQTLCQGFNGVNTTVLQGFNGVERGFCDLSHQISDCCCTTKGAIADLKYTVGQEACDTRHAIYNSSRDIIDNANANSRAILDFLTQDKIATLTAENQSLKFQASQTAQNGYIDAIGNSIVARLQTPQPVPAYMVANPNCCYTNHCGCNGGF